MGEIAHFRAGFSEELVIFWSSFFGSGFGSAGAFLEKIRGNESEHFVDETLLLSRGAGRGMNDISEVARGI